MCGVPEQCETSFILFGTHKLDATVKCKPDITNILIPKEAVYIFENRRVKETLMKLLDPAPSCITVARTSNHPMYKTTFEGKSNDFD